MYCKKCGKIVMNGDICPECAAEQSAVVSQQNHVAESGGETQNPGNANPQINVSPLANGGGNDNANTEEKLKRTFWEWVILISAGLVFAVYVCSEVSLLTVDSGVSIGSVFSCVFLCALFGLFLFSYAFIQSEACRNARSANKRCDQLLELYHKKFPNQDPPFDMHLMDLKYSLGEISIIVFGCGGSVFCILAMFFYSFVNYGFESVSLSFFSSVVYFLVCAVLAVIILASTFVFVQMSRGARLTYKKCSLLFDELNKVDR